MKVAREAGGGGAGSIVVERTVVSLGLATVLVASLTEHTAFADAVRHHAPLLAAFVVAIAAGELLRVRMPSGRVAAPIASGSAIGLAVLGPIDGHSPFDVPAGVVTLVVAAALEPHVVVGADAGEEGDLLPAQPRHPPARPRGQAGALGGDEGAAGLEVLAERVRRGGRIHAPDATPPTVPGQGPCHSPDQPGSGRLRRRRSPLRFRLPPTA